MEHLLVKKNELRRNTTHLSNAHSCVGWVHACRTLLPASRCAQRKPRGVTNPILPVRRGYGAYISSFNVCLSILISALWEGVSTPAIKLTIQDKMENGSSTLKQYFPRFAESTVWGVRCRIFFHVEGIIRNEWISVWISLGCCKLLS